SAVEVEGGNRVLAPAALAGLAAVRAEEGAARRIRRVARQPGQFVLLRLDFPAALRAKGRQPLDGERPAQPVEIVRRYTLADEMAGQHLAPPDGLHLGEDMPPGSRRLHHLRRQGAFQMLEYQQRVGPGFGR